VELVLATEGRAAGRGDINGVKADGTGGHCFLFLLLGYCYRE
jgi:hypothetical protein